jgi:hypothetical protein
MKLNPIKSNMTELELNDKVILFSYKTPVAMCDYSNIYKTDRYYSQTTSKHINQWANMRNTSKDELLTISQLELNNLVEGV